MNFILLLTAVFGIAVGYLGRSLYEQRRLARIRKTLFEVETPALGINPLIIEIYRDVDEEWRWRAKRSGRIVADSGEGYKDVDTMAKTLSHLLGTIGKRGYTLACKVPGYGVSWNSDGAVLPFTVHEKETETAG